MQTYEIDSKKCGPMVLDALLKIKVMNRIHTHTILFNLFYYYYSMI
jgi:succinate dehydrogenase/fumarate reductase-like Fe-S protein